MPHYKRFTTAFALIAAASLNAVFIQNAAADTLTNTHKKPAAAAQEKSRSSAKPADVQNKPDSAKFANDDLLQATTVPEIVVTANRVPTPIEQTGATVAVIGEQQIQDTQLQTVADALNQLPGISVATPGTPGQVATVFVRGVPTDSNLVMLDGRRLPVNLAGSYGIENFSLENVSSIEVAEGPMSSVQGGSAIGGVINIRTKSGKDAIQPGYSASFEGGSYYSFNEKLSAVGKIGAFDYSAQFNRLDTSNNRLNNRFRLTNFTTRDGYQINDKLYADLLFFYNLTDGGQPNTIFSPDLKAHLVQETWLISPGIKWQTTDWWKQTIYYSHAQLRQAATGFPTLSGLNYGQDNRTQVNTEQVDYQSEFQIAHNWKVTPGFSFTYNDYYRKIDVPNDFNFPPTPAGTKDVQNSFTNIAGFIENQWSPVTGLNLIGNVRYDHESDFGDNFTWRTGASYKIKPTQTLIHASYGTGFEPPTPQDIAPALYGNTEVKPERSRGFDAGIKQSFWDKKITVGGTYFNNNIRDYILYNPAAFSLQNIGEVQTDGGEFSLKFQPIKQIGITLSYTYTDANNLTDGVRLVRVPRHQVAFSVIGKPCKSVVLSVGGTWMLDRQDFNQAGMQAPLPDYFVLRATASWQVNDHFQIFARLENALNENYQQVAGYPSLGRTIYGGFKLTF